MAPTVDTIDPGEMAVNYGFALSVLNGNPELAAKFKVAVAQGWTTDRFIAEIRGTNWFKTKSDTTREWAILQGADPATATQRLLARQATLRAEETQLGVHLSAAQLNTLANNSIMFGWTDQELRQTMGQAFHYSSTIGGTPTQGLAATSIDKMRTTASDYAIPVSDATLQSWTQRVIEGLATPDDFTEYAKQQAKSLYPPLSDAIDKGVTVAQYADPYKQMAQQTLGINPADINFSDPKWNAALNQVDPTTKQRAPMSLADWGTKIRTDSQYGYDQTATARDTGAQVVAALGQKMGF
jgi:hypothetical protein